MLALGRPALDDQFTHPSRAPLDDHHSWHADERSGLHTLAVAGPIDGMFGIFSVDITH